jgi:hypothetical protein
MKLHWQQGKCVKIVNKKNTHPATWNGTAELEGLPALLQYPGNARQPIISHT